MAADFSPTDGREAGIVQLSIAIVSYNTRALTLACLRSLVINPPRVTFEVLFVDNHSTDGSLEAVQAEFPNVQIIDSPGNIGFAAANNLIFEQARGERFLLLNPDTVVRADTFDAIWDFAERSPSRGIWGGRTLFADGSLNPTSCWRQSSVWSLFCSTAGLSYLFPASPIFASESYGGWLRDTEREVDIVTGCFLMIDSQLWRKLGGFDRTFFMYAEEADLCLRARAFGARPAITPNAQLIHYGGKSEVTGADKIVKTMRGKVTLMAKHWSPLRYRAGQALLLVWAFSRIVGSIFFAGRRDDPAQAKSKWRAVWRRRHEWLAGYPILGKR